MPMEGKLENQVLFIFQFCSIQEEASWGCVIVWRCGPVWYECWQ